MLKRDVNSVIGVAVVLALTLSTRAQTVPPKQPAVAKSQKAAPAPRRDLSGIWDVGDRMEGISPTGVKSHAPFTAWGADVANNLYKPGDGPRRVPIGLVNDPLDSSDLRVEERYHRVNHDTMELTVKIDDPKAYTEPWLGRDRFRLTLLPASTSFMEMICAPTEAEAYKKVIANPLSK